MLTLLGLLMIAGNIFATVYTLGGFRKSPQWLTITAGVFAILFFFGVVAALMDR